MALALVKEIFGEAAASTQWAHSKPGKHKHTQQHTPHTNAKHEHLTNHHVSNTSGYNITLGSHQAAS